MSAPAGDLPLTNPWHYAKKEGREYITPEDIADALTAGATKLELWDTVLEALAKKQVEDWSLCAHVAHVNPSKGGWPSNE